MGRVLYVAAHPDDENTQLITYLARGRNYRTAYISLTRGDGGQNVLGGEFGSALGLIRTHELLEARKIDGAQQFFTRALDFGFSKSADETLRIWDRQQVLGDVVRVIRQFRPDVIITRFSPVPGGTHGHHTASAILALEAFKLAGDPKAFPEQLRDVRPWQPKRILQNGRGAGDLSLDISGNDPATGEPLFQVAGRSRAMHKSQGFDGYQSGEPRPESFTLLDGEPAAKDIFDGVDTTWNRFPGGAEVGQQASQVLAAFDPSDPSASVPALLQLRARMDRVGTQPPVSLNGVQDSVLAEKKRDLDRIIQHCVGLSVSTTVAQAESLPGETLRLRHTAIVRSKVPVRWISVYYPSVGKENYRFPQATLQQDQTTVRETTRPLSLQTPLSQPYWLRQEPVGGMSRVEMPALIGLPENPAVFPSQHIFEIGGQTIVVPDEPVQVLAATDGARTRRLEVIAPVSLRFSTPVRVFAPGSTRAVEVEVLSARANASGSVSLDAPAEWKVQPANQAFKLGAAGSRARYSFNISAPNTSGAADITAKALVNGKTVSAQRVEINYPHIPPLLLQPPAQLKALALDLKIRGRNVGYIPGAGDSVAEAIDQMGYAVTTLSGADLTPDKLRTLDAVVIGVRASNVRDDLAAKMDTLFAYVESGGTLIAQYNRPDRLKVPADKLAPFPLALSGQRVTNEEAPVTFLAPDHPALNTPNKITEADFTGWVQERGIYFPSAWGEKFVPLLSSGDPGEEPLKGSLLVAQHGRGHFVYTGLAMFRQLPAGVPGAYRLFANLISLGK
jgi:LmbE family N-acetylglucosaminyl deacetylase